VAEEALQVAMKQPQAQSLEALVGLERILEGLLLL
jgi:hypothetical protein